MSNEKEKLKSAINEQMGVIITGAEEISNLYSGRVKVTISLEPDKSSDPSAVFKDADGYEWIHMVRSFIPEETH